MDGWRSRSAQQWQSHLPPTFQESDFIIGLFNAADTNSDKKIILYLDNFSSAVESKTLSIVDCV